MDACGYLGYSPPSQFDPLLAKLIGSSSSLQAEGEDSAYLAALNRTLHALDQFHIGGVQTNLDQLRAILSHPNVRSGDARTSLLSEEPGFQLASSEKPGDRTLAFLAQQAANMVTTVARRGQARMIPVLSINVEENQLGVECPMDSSVLEIHVEEGDKVSIGDTLFVVSAMKMETVISAPCSGTVVALQPLKTGDMVL